jgi:YVTN family beta-propeller protein
LSDSPLDPDADPSRRAWLACPNCDHGSGCLECQGTRNCGIHWQYLLTNSGTQVFLQCPTCFCLWTVDTAGDDVHAPGMVHGNGRRIAYPEGRGDMACDAVIPHRGGSGDWQHDGAVVAKTWLGDCPRDVVTSPDGELVYVMTADSVKAVNSFHNIVASIPTGTETKQMLMSSDGSRIYVLGYDGALSIIDTFEMTARTWVSQRSTAAVVSPDGDHIYLAHGDADGDRSSAWISVIRADGTSVALIAVDRYTTSMALSPGGRRLYVASAGHRRDDRAGTITVIDTATHKTVNFIAVDAAPDTITVDAEGLLYLTHFHSNSISVVDPGTRCAIAIALDDAPMEVVACPTSEFIYTVNSQSVTAIDTSTATIKGLMIGELPRRVSVSADGRRLYATDFAHGTIWSLDTSDHSVTATVPVCAHPAAVALSTSGEFLYVTDSRDGTLTVVSTATVKPNSPDIP